MLYNSGTLANSGTLNNYSGGTLQNDVPFYNMAGTLIDTYSDTLTNSGALNNSSTLINNSGDTFTNTGTLKNSGTINRDGAFTQTAGQFINNGIATQASFNINGGSPSGTGTINGNVTIAKGASANPGNALTTGPCTLSINGAFASSGNMLLISVGWAPGYTPNWTSKAAPSLAEITSRPISLTAIPP